MNSGLRWTGIGGGLGGALGVPCGGRPQQAQARPGVRDEIGIGERDYAAFERGLVEMQDAYSARMSPSSGRSRRPRWPATSRRS